MRTWLYDKLKVHTPLTDIIPVAAIHASGSLVDAPSIRPFMVTRLGVIVGSSTSKIQLVELRVHDDAGSLVRIDTALDAAKGAIVGQVIDDDDLIQVDYLQRSSDLSDPGWGTILRFDTYRVAMKPGG